MLQARNPGRKLRSAAGSARSRNRRRPRKTAQQAAHRGERRRARQALSRCQQALRGRAALKKRCTAMSRPPARSHQSELPLGGRRRPQPRRHRADSSPRPKPACGRCWPALAPPLRTLWSSTLRTLKPLSISRIGRRRRCAVSQGRSTSSAAGLGRRPVPLAPTAGIHSFHLRTSQRQIIQQVFKAYRHRCHPGRKRPRHAVPVRHRRCQFRPGHAGPGLITNTFYVPVDAHRVLVAADTRTNRQQFTRQEMETIYLSGLRCD